MDRIIMTQYWILQRWCGYNERLLFLFTSTFHDDVIQWKHFPRYWPFVRGNHQSPLDTPHKVQWLGALMFSLICAWRNGWANNRDAGDVRGHRAHYGATTVMGPWFVRVPLIRQFTKPSPAQLRPRLLSWTQVNMTKSCLKKTKMCILGGHL